MKKKILALLLAGTMVFSLAGCGSEPAEKTPAAGGETSAAQETSAPEEATDEAASAAGDNGEAPYVIWVNPLVGSAVFTSADNGITAASEEFGFKLKIIGPSVLDDTQMYEAVQSAIVEQPDLIVTTPYNYSAIQGLYADAQGKDIPIINISSDSEESGRVSFIGTDNTAYGQLAADYVNEKMGGEANVLIMMANLDTSNQLEQKTAFEEKCAADYPNIKVVLTDEDIGESATALL